MLVLRNVVVHNTFIYPPCGIVSNLKKKIDQFGYPFFVFGIW